MKTMFKISIMFITTIILISCDNSGKDPKATGRFTSINSGTFTCNIDEAIWDYLQPVIHMYDSAYPEIHAKFIKSTSREAMAQLLSGNTKAIITPRDYLRDEDSLMKAFKVAEHERAIYALDGLVFYARKDFQLDTLNDFQVKDVLKNPGSNLKKYYPQLISEPVFVCNDYNSSEYANLKMIALIGEPAAKKIIFKKDFKAVKKYIYENPNTIGIGYLSQMYNDDNIKLIRIGFNDSTGKHIMPQYVHQANILRNLYPYIVTHYVYILEKRQNLVYWFAKYFEREFIVQSYFNNTGIVPAFAKIRLIDDE